jgi:hypothetical protein
LLKREGLGVKIRMKYIGGLKTLALPLLLGAVIGLGHWLKGEETAPEQPAEAPPPVPKGVEVMARGPIHEAFASPTTQPAPTKSVPKQPPKPINEVPPEDKPAGEVVWIGGYWGWDDDRNDFLWVSGVWRTVPPGKQWVAGYWREQGEQWQWVNGFWSEAAPKGGEVKQVTYLPEPPKPPEVAAPGQAPNQESFYVPGNYVWNGESYAWRAGYWARVQPGYVWVQAHYCWTPSGYVFIPGYWDYAVSRRGFLYAPVVVNYEVVGPTFVYTPAYAVTDTIVLDSLFIRPCCCHYYFGDYYGVRYQGLGFESCVVYSRGHYDSIIVYECYERRSDPAWLSVQIDLCSRRDRGLAPCPPRTLVQQNIIQQNITNTTIVNNRTTVINNNVVNNNVTNNITKNNITNNKNVSNTTALMPASKLAAAKNIQTVKLDATSRNQALAQSRAIQQAASQRSKAEIASPGIPTRPRQASITMPKVQPVRAATEPRTAPPGGAGGKAGQARPFGQRTATSTAGNGAAGARTGNTLTRPSAPAAHPSAPAGSPGGTAPKTFPLQTPGRLTSPVGTRPPLNRQAPPYRPAPNRQPPPKRPPNNP